MRRSLLALAVVANGIAATALLGITPATAGGGCGADATFEVGTTTVHAKHACWGPTVTQVREGDTVTFENPEGVEHNITGPGPIGFHDFGANAVVRITFRDAGIFPYACTFHPGMSGAVVVGNPLSAAATPTPAAATPAVSLSTDDADDGSLLGTTPRRVGTGVAVAGALGTAGFLVVRRRRAELPAA